MKKHSLAKVAVAVACVAFALAGCGGGSSTFVGGTSGTGTSRAAIFLTDSPREDYGHIWATIYHVELVPQTGAAVAVFDDPAGKMVDLRRLRDDSGGRFSFLANATIGATIQVFRNGAAVGDPLPVDSSLTKDANGHPVASLTFNRPKTLGESTNTIVIDFDLAHFVVKASGILPVVRDGDPSGIANPERHNPDEYRGVVSSLSGTAPELTFTLTGRDGHATTVVTNASTALYGTGTIANGAMVNVEGTLDATTQNLVATRLEVCPVRPPAGAFGTASNLDAAAGTFTLTIVRARGFTPGQTTVKIVTNASTVFHADSGDTQTPAEFFTALAATPTVHVDGVYDSATNTLTATRAKVMDAEQDGGGQHGPHAYRPGVDASNWGHGMLAD